MVTVHHIGDIITVETADNRGLVGIITGQSAGQLKVATFDGHTFVCSPDRVIFVRANYFDTKLLQKSVRQLLAH